MSNRLVHCDLIELFYTFLNRPSHVMDNAYLTKRIAKTKVVIEAYEDAILALTGAGAVESYTLDTGQSRQTVTRSNLKELNTTLDGLYNRLGTMEARQTGGGVVTVRPSW